jgi:hypothetical protein
VKSRLSSAAAAQAGEYRVARAELYIRTYARVVGWWNARKRGEADARRSRAVVAGGRCHVQISKPAAVVVDASVPSPPREHHRSFARRLVV